MKTKISLLLLGLSAVLICAFVPKIPDKMVTYEGQTCPPDMEFITGNDSIPSFFMGKMEETNMDWAIYLSWLEYIYSEWHGIKKDATPHNIPVTESPKGNDPILTSQLTNPALAYYPVTNCDWIQIQNYLAWKTDRMNEEILIRNDIFRRNPSQTRDDAFNTEARVYAQYDGMKGKTIMPEYILNSDKGERSLFLNAPQFLTGYRLPTEEEWEYASRSESTNAHFSNNKKFAFGNNYYLRHYAYSLWVYNYNERKTHPLYIYLNSISNSASPPSGNNLKEWMLDEYTNEKKHYRSQEEKFTSNGLFKATDFQCKNADGYIKDKDTFGHMPFRIMGICDNGQDLRILNYQGRGLSNSKLNLPGDTITRYRVVKGGAGSTSRIKMKETNASADIGFHAVIQYTGIPIKKKYKVNWETNEKARVLK